MGYDILSKTLITGTKGMVGSYVDFGIRTDRSSLDIKDFNKTKEVIQRWRPMVIIHLAAETDMERCEQDPNHAYMVNAVGTYNVTTAARSVGAKMVYISTDAVFDGLKGTPYLKDDEPNPQNFYGMSKYIGELVVRGMLSDYAIVRTGWVFGGGPQKDKKFVAKIIRQLARSDVNEIKVVTDLRSSPTFGKDLVNILKHLILYKKKGVFHVVNQGICSRYDIAREVVTNLRRNVRVTPVDSSFFTSSAKPVNTGGLASKVITMRSWQEALKEYLETEWKGF